MSVMPLHLVFFLMDILDHKLIWLLLQKTKLTTSEHMTLSVTKVTELENMDSSLVPHLLFIKRSFQNKICLGLINIQVEITAEVVEEVVETMES